MNKENHLQQIIGKARLTPISDLTNQLTHPNPAIRRRANKEARKRIKNLKKKDPALSGKTQRLLNDLKNCLPRDMPLIYRTAIILVVTIGTNLITHQISGQFRVEWDSFGTYTERDVLVWGLTLLVFLWSILKTSRF